MAHDRMPDEAPRSATTPYPREDYYPDPRQYQAPSNLVPPSSYPSDAPRQRSRASSSVARPPPPPPPPIQPVYDAVSDAFDNSAAANQVPDEIIRQITEQVRSQVIHSLKSEGYAAPPPASAPPQAQYAFQPPPTAIPREQSPAKNTVPIANAQPRRPRSPVRRVSSESSSGPSHRRSPSPPSRQSGGSSPFDPPAQDPYFASNGDIKKENISARYGDRSEADTMPRRPTIPVSASSSEEVTTLEKIWQPLFDVNGEPTPRLGQFLRGVALHIIEDYEPKNSLVITPTKLKRFYDDVKLHEETYPWQSIFRLNNASIGKIYRDLKLPHFYIQDRVSDPPTIPALTPEGFQRWMTLHIQAHPQAEFERLAKTVRDMPINNADDRKERFPKELSRRLLPKYDDSKTRQYTSAALSADNQVNLPKHTSFPPPPPPGPAASSSQTSNTFAERERAPYGSQPPPLARESTRETTREPTREAARDSAIVSDDEDDLRPSIPIERERKPYTAKEGTGKFYENEKAATSSSRTLKPETSNTSKHRPSSAFIEREGDNHSDSSRASDYTATTGGAAGVRRTRTYSKSSRRPRSPISATSGNPYVKSESSVNDMPPSFYSSNVYNNAERNDRDRYTDDGDRYSERERERNRGDKDRGDRDRDRERERERERDRELRELREREDYIRRRDEVEGRFSQYDGEPLSRRTTVDGGYLPPGYGQYQPPLGQGQRHYG